MGECPAHSVHRGEFYNEGRKNPCPPDHINLSIASFATMYPQIPPTMKDITTEELSAKHKIDASPKQPSIQYKKYKIKYFML